MLLLCCCCRRRCRCRSRCRRCCCCRCRCRCRCCCCWPQPHVNAQNDPSERTWFRMVCAVFRACLHIKKCILTAQARASRVHSGGGWGKNGKSRGPGGWSVDGSLLCFFIFISNLLTTLSVFKRGFLGSLFIVFVKVIIWVIAPLVHCWAGGRHFFSFERVSPFSSYQVLGCWWCICFVSVFLTNFHL